MAWTCPSCNRQFARNRQSHDCAPAMTLEEYFSSGPLHEKPIFDAVMSYVEKLGPVHVEPVSVGIFLKNPRCFAQLRPKDKWVALWFSLPRKVTHPTITRKVVQYQGRFHHVANLRSPEEVDDRLGEYLAEAYADR